MQLVYVAFLVLCGIISSNTIAAILLDPDTGLSLFQFITRHGYSYEKYTVVTDDGYILTTTRIIGGENDTTTTNSTKPAVLVLHGLFSGPEDFVLNEESSIGFLLVEQGYDVFLMACRGNTLSLGHVNLTSDSSEYWNFSWHELGYYDIPANIDLVTNITGNAKVSYIGHSQGGTSFMVMSATRPEYRAKVKMAHLFGPVVYSDGSRFPFIDVIRDNLDLLEELSTDLQLNKGLLTYSPLILALATVFCNANAPTVSLCVDLLGEIAGPDPLQMDTSKLTVITSYNPGGGSVKEVFHYFQVSKSSIFRQFDYGSGNELIYGQAEPPVYNLSAINDVPIYVWYGANDYFSGISDSLRLVKETPSAVAKLVPYLLWNHIDFTYAVDAQTYLYNSVLRILNQG